MEINLQYKFQRGQTIAELCRRIRTQKKRQDWKRGSNEGVSKVPHGIPNTWLSWETPGASSGWVTGQNSKDALAPGKWFAAKQGQGKRLAQKQISTGKNFAVKSPVRKTACALYQKEGITYHQCHQQGSKEKTESHSEGIRGGCSVLSSLPPMF
jgi:hypothetical protein